MNAPREELPDAIWVISDVMPDGTYGAVIHFSPDLAYSVPGGADLGTYVTAVLSAAAAAKYDAAVLAQLTRVSSAEAAAEAVGHLRKQRNQTEWRAGPMTLTPGISAFDKKPFLRCAAGAQVWQWNPDDVLRHVGDVLQVAVGVADDTRYHRLLVDHISLDEPTARAVVGDLSSFFAGGL